MPLSGKFRTPAACQLVGHVGASRLPDETGTVGEVDGFHDEAGPIPC